MEPEMKQQFTDEEIHCITDKINQIEAILEGTNLYLVSNILQYLDFRLKANMDRGLKEIQQQEAN